MFILTYIFENSEAGFVLEYNFAQKQRINMQNRMEVQNHLLSLTMYTNVE